MASATFGDKSGPGGVQWNRASPYAQEMAKWEMGWNPYGMPGRPREQVGSPQWPAMFYKVKRHETSGQIVVEHMEQADEENAPNMLSRGYVQGLGEAHAALEKAEQDLALGAAIRARQDMNMSEKAKAEAAAYEATTAQHVAEIPARRTK